MGICIENRTEVPLRIYDRYEFNPETKTGYDGVKIYLIAGGENKTIQASVFTMEVTKYEHPQKICVRREDGNGKPELILFHDEFDNNDGSHLLLENDGPTHLTYRFVSPNGGEEGRGRGGANINIFQKFRKFFRLN